jgi:hypothetical protein
MAQTNAASPLDSLCSGKSGWLEMTICTDVTKMKENASGSLEKSRPHDLLQLCVRNAGLTLCLPVTTIFELLIHEIACKLHSQELETWVQLVTPTVK